MNEVITVDAGRLGSKAIKLVTVLFAIRNCFHKSVNNRDQVNVPKNFINHGLRFIYVIYI